METMILLKRTFVCFLLMINMNSSAQQPYWKNRQVTNPFIPGYFADPSVLVDNNRFYIYATIDPWGGDSLALWVSDDFKHWYNKPLNWPTKSLCSSPTSNDSKVWAPSVKKGADGRFHMFVSVGSEIYAGISNHPEGPWENVKADGSPFIKTQKSINVHTIDSEIFMDDNGRSYLYWGSGWNWKDGHCFVGELNKQMDGFMGIPKDVTPPNYFEAPYMLKRNGTYYLMYSQGKCTDSTYKVRYSTSKSLYGPWKEGENSPILSTDVSKHIMGPGHHTILKLKDKYYIIYHRIADVPLPGLHRELCVDEMRFDKAGNIKVVHPTNSGVILPAINTLKRNH